MRISGLNDEKLVGAIVHGDETERNEALQSVYRDCFPSIKGYVLKNNGSVDEAQDVFQDGVIALYRNISANKFKNQASLSSYLYSICRNIWRIKLRKKYPTLEIQEDHLDEGSASPPKFNGELLNLILDKLSEDCKKLLIAFYYKRQSMVDLMKMFGLKSEQIAKTKKYRCMRDMMGFVKAHGLTIEHFLE